jgi:hypothetical protein
MSVEISIPDNLYARLQRLATPFVDTPASVIERLLDHYEEGQGSSNRPPGTALTLDPDRPDDLRHTRVLHAVFCGESARNWNDLLQVAHRAAFRKAGSYDALRFMTTTNIIRGRKTDSGFVYLDDIDISIQNIEANRCWQTVLHLAKKLNGSVEVELEWRDKEGAAHPGRAAVLRWPSDK